MVTSPRTPIKDLLRTAEDYRHYAQKKSNAHYRMSEKAAASGRRFGIPVTVATTIVGTSIFATISSPQQSLVLQIGTGLLSLGAAVFSALHTFFNFAEIAAQHKGAAAEYEGVRHELDAFLLGTYELDTPENLRAAVQQLREISQHLDEIAKRAPTIPDHVYDSAQTRVATRPWARCAGAETRAAGTWSLACRAARRSALARTRRASSH